MAPHAKWFRDKLLSLMATLVGEDSLPEGSTANINTFLPKAFGGVGFRDPVAHHALARLAMLAAAAGELRSITPSGKPEDVRCLQGRWMNDLLSRSNKAMKKWTGEGAGRNGWPVIQSPDEFFALYADGSFRGRGYQELATELVLAQDPLDMMKRAKEAVVQGPQAWMTPVEVAACWLNTYEADLPFTEHEHMVALRSWLMLPPIADLPDEPCVCGNLAPGQMHAMRCKTVRRRLTTGRHVAIQHELIRASKAAGLKVELEPVLRMKEACPTSKRTDFAITTAYMTTHYDVSVVDQGAPSYVRRAASEDRAAAKQREGLKYRKYAVEMETMGEEIVPVVFEVGGASGDGVTELLRKIVEAETKSGGRIKADARTSSEAIAHPATAQCTHAPG